MPLTPDNLVKSIIDSFNYAIFVLDTDGMILELNGAALSITEANRDDVIGQPIWNLEKQAVSRGSQTRWEESCREAARGKESLVHLDIPVGSDASAQSRTGFSLTPLKDVSGEISCLLAKLEERPSRSAVEEQSPKRQSSAAAVEREVTFRLMVESIEDYAMFMVNLEGIITSWNRGAERLTGYSEVEALGRHFSMLYPREELDKSHATHELASALRHGRYEEEGTRVRKDGSRYHAQIMVWRIDDNDGQTLGFAKITRDVTALKHAQRQAAQLFESENRFRLMVESIEDYAMFMVDTNGIITSWNRGAESLTGYAESEALGRPFSILYPKEELTEDHAAYELAMARRHGHHEEEGLRVRKNGSTYHAQVIVWPVESREGDIIGFAKITRDVTERRKAEQALRDSEAKFRTITDAMPQMVWSASLTGEQEYANQQWFHFTGMEDTATRGHGWLDLVHPDDRQQAGQSWERCIGNGSIYEAQFRLRHVSGAYRWVLGRALPVLSDDGKIIRWMGTFTDIHEQKRAEATLQDSARRKDEFLAILAHELRNPLAPIRNSTALVRRIGDSEGQVGKILDVIERQVHHMTRLIDDLLDVARISRGKIKLSREIVDLRELTTHTVNDFRAEFEVKGVRLRLDTPEQSLPLLADRTRIAQAIGNLLHNALKFTDANGSVCVTLAQQVCDGRSFALIKVKDTGTGIDPHLLENLFVPFIQADQDLARSQGGLGLGLALIKGFVDLHGGHIEALSEGLGRGSEFRVHLPLTTLPKEGATMTVHATETSGGLRIVLIDDSQDTVETLALLLAMEGHEVKSAYDGESGLRLIQVEKPDLVLCDIGLPGAKDGYAVARAVRAEPTVSSTYMVAVSGYGQEQHRQLSAESGFDDHLLKPVSLDELKSAIAAAGRNA